MPRLSSLLRPAWRRVRQRWGALRAGGRAFVESLRSTRKVSVAKAKVRLRQLFPHAHELPPQDGLPISEPSLLGARAELLLLCVGLLHALWAHAPGGDRVELFLLALATVTLVLMTLRSGKWLLARRALLAWMLWLQPEEGALLRWVCAFLIASSVRRAAEALWALRGLPSQWTPPWPWSGRWPLRAASFAALPLCVLAAWGSAEDRPLVWLHRTMIGYQALLWGGLAALAWLVGRLRAMELGAPQRARAALAALAAGAALALGLGAGPAGRALSATTVGLMLSASLVVPAANRFDPLRGVRRARALWSLAVIAVPAAAWCALWAADMPQHRSWIAVASLALGAAAMQLHRRVSARAGASDGEWARAFDEARARAERRHPFEAITRSLEIVQNARDAERAPSVLVLETAERFDVDRAGYVHRAQAAYPTELAALALAEPFNTLRAELLEHLEVRHPQVRQMAAWMRAESLRCVCVGVVDGEPAVALLVPQGRRARELSLEEHLAIKRYADVLASQVAILHARQQTAAREQQLRLEAEHSADALLRRQAFWTERASALRWHAEWQAREALPVWVAPASRLAQDALEFRARYAQPTFVEAAPGDDALSAIARAHLSGPRAKEPLVWIDALQPQRLDAWLDPQRSPCSAADRGTLVIADVRHLPPALQRLLAHVLRSRCLPEHDARPLDFALVLTSAVPLERLLASGELTPELAERLGPTPTVRWPELTQRSEEIHGLLLRKLAREGVRLHGRPLALDEAGFALLVEHRFVGGERELDALVVALARMAAGEVISRGEVLAALSRLHPAPADRAATDELERAQAAVPRGGVARRRRPHRS